MVELGSVLTLRNFMRHLRKRTSSSKAVAVHAYAASPNDEGIQQSAPEHYKLPDGTEDAVV